MPAKPQRTPQRTQKRARRPLASAPAPVRRRERSPDGFPVEHLEAGLARSGLTFPPYLVGSLAAAIDSGKHVILTGPPGTGKTTLAYMAADAAASTMLCSGYLPTTATSGWTTDETIGSLVMTREGMVFRAGLFVDAMQTGRWLIIVEINRADLDLSFGPLFTVLSGSSVVLPFARPGHTAPVSIGPSGADVPKGTEPIQVPNSWRLLATMNVFDKDTLHRLSYALMRRFAFIEVPSPDDEAMQGLIQGPGDFVLSLLDLRKLRDLGPAIFLDAQRFAAHRIDDGVSESRALLEAFYSFFLPQFDGMGEEGSHLYDTLSKVFAAPERDDLRRAIRTVLGARR
jgi:DNA polymerase III delta prime subunit